MSRITEQKAKFVTASELVQTRVELKLRVCVKINAFVIEIQKLTRLANSLILFTD